MKSRLLAMSVLAMILALCPETIWAQQPGGGQIVTTGVTTVKVMPTLLRLEAEIAATGDTAEKAVEKLKKLRKAALAQLKELKADEGTIHVTNTAVALVETPNYTQPGFGVPTYVPPLMPAAEGTFIPAAPSSSPPTLPMSPSPSTEPSTSYRVPLSETAVSESAQPSLENTPEATPPSISSPNAVPTYANAPGVAPLLPYNEVIPNNPFIPGVPGSAGPSFQPVAPTSQKSYEATTTVRAQWRLTSSDPDAIALQGEALREKLVKAKTLGKSDSNRANSVSRSTIYGASPYPHISNGGFTLSFVGTLSDAQRKAALAEAVAKARQQASDLAEAAGGSVGEFSLISHDISASPFPQLQLMPGPVVSGGPFPYFNEAQNVAIAPTPDLPDFMIRVNADFKLLPKNP